MNKGGFTLLEILIVIVIIGILAGVVGVFLGQARTSAADATIKSSLEALRKETSIYFNDDNLGDGSYGTFNNPNFATCLTVAPTFLTSALACGGPGGVTGVVCNDAKIKSRELINRAVEASGVGSASASRCRLFPVDTNTNGWVVGVSLKSAPSSSFWCVDSLGNSKNVSGLLTTVFSTAPANTYFSCP